MKSTCLFEISAAGYWFPYLLRQEISQNEGENARAAFMLGDVCVGCTYAGGKCHRFPAQ